MFENPLTSMMWLHPLLISLCRKDCAEAHVFDQCQFGAPWKKATKFVSWRCGHELFLTKKCFVTTAFAADPTNRTSSSVDALNNMACSGFLWHKGTLHSSANTSRAELLINLHIFNFNNILGVVKNHDIQALPLSEFRKERGRASRFCYDILAASSQVLLNRAFMGTVAGCDYLFLSHVPGSL